jgi:hypothetical protein
MWNPPESETTDNIARLATSNPACAREAVTELELESRRSTERDVVAQVASLETALKPAQLNLDRLRSAHQSPSPQSVRTSTSHRSKRSGLRQSQLRPASSSACSRVSCRGSPAFPRAWHRPRRRQEAVEAQALPRLCLGTPRLPTSDANLATPCVGAVSKAHFGLRALALPAALALLALATAANSNALMAQRSDGGKPGDLALPLRRSGKIVIAAEPWARTSQTASASRTRFVIASGCEISAKWLASISIVFAPIRLAMKRCMSGLIVRSCVDTA